MKIVFFSPQFLPLVGGLENVVRDWAYGLSKEHHEVQVITTTKGESDGIFPFQVLRNISQFRVWRLMRGADVIVLFNVSLKGLLPCLLSFRPIVVSHQSTNFDFSGNWNRFGRIKQLFADYIPYANIACSNYVAKFLKKRPIVIHNPYNSNLFKLNPNIERKEDLVFLGRLVSDKGCDVLIRALGVIKQNYSIHPRLTIIGTGPELDPLKALGARENVVNQINFVGGKTGMDLVNTLNAHKILIVPSTWEEPFGIVALEGLACGCQVLVSDAGGLPEAVGACGRLFENGNTGELALALKGALDEKLEFANPDAVSAHLNNFTVTSTVNELIKVLNAATA